MQTTTRQLPASKRLALVAHDHCKPRLIEWCKSNAHKLQQHELFGTGTTGRLISQATGLDLTPLLSGPMGGDQQLGALIAEAKIDALVFFWDPLDAVPHDPDVKALLRLATVWNIPVATNLASADLMINSEAFDRALLITVPDYESYISARAVKP